MPTFREIFHTLGFKLIFWVGLILLVIIIAWAYFSIQYQRQKALDYVVSEADRLGNTIRLGTHYAMMLNSRDDINQITNNIGKQREIENLRIYNKQGRIKFSSRTGEVDKGTNIKDEACFACHKQDPPLETVGLGERTRIFDSGRGYRLLGVISPIYNEPGCSTGDCHVHPEDKKVLGLLDVVISLESTDKEIASYKKAVTVLAVLIFLGASGFIGIFLLRFVNRPINRLIQATRRIGNGDYDYKTDVERKDEIGQLALSVHQMGKEIGAKQREINKQRDEYEDLFEQSPCYITVQDKNFRILKYNAEFARYFNPVPRDYCYHAYKGRAERCEICPVEKTFEDGQAHFSEQAGINKDGTETFWMVRTAPIKDEKGGIVAAMELSIDITEMKRLEKEVKRSEEKYHTFFNNIPNPVFVVDQEDLKILDCNHSVQSVYGYDRRELLLTSFLDLFERAERNRHASEIRKLNVINQARQLHKDGRVIFVNIRISPSEYQDRSVLLVTTSDITERLMVEQQLIQAGKMATLGEMATGVAHELNQPLTVIKTSSSFLNKKVVKNEPIKKEILKTLAEEIDKHVDRASKIIGHMREFGRKSDVRKERVDVNAVLRNAFEIFSQQLKLREIEVIKELDDPLPPILADYNRLEQVFINLLINARDAIEEKMESTGDKRCGKCIFLRTGTRGGKVIIEIQDTGAGIPESLLNKIFEPFFTTKKVGKGTGLGLAISYGIIRDYEGDIKVDTREGEGSTFIIAFPAAPDEG